MSPEANAASLAPRATSSGCPRSTCREFLHLRSNDHGYELWCPKCGFVIGLAAEAKIADLAPLKRERESRKARSSWKLIAVLIAVLIGLVIFWWVR
jgi:hypothetical protein